MPADLMNGRPSRRRAAQDLWEQLDLYDVALLHGNSNHVVNVALVSLAQHGAIDCGESVVEDLLRSARMSLADLQVRRPDLTGVGFAIRAIAGGAPVSDPVERAVYDVVVRTPVRNGNVATIRSEAAPVVRRIVHERLERRGLVRSDAQRAVAGQWAVRVISLVSFAIIVGAVVAGRSTGNWYGLTVAPLFAVLVGAAFLLVEDLTLRGWRWVRATQRTHRAPAGVGKGKAPLGRTSEMGSVFALYGDLFLWRYDPALALALGLEHLNDLEGLGGG